MNCPSPGCNGELESKSNNTYICKECNEVWRKSNENDKLKKSKVAHG